MLLRSRRARPARQLARSLADSYLAHATCVLIARDPRAAALLPPAEAGERAPMGRLVTRDGTHVRFNLEHYFERARDAVIASEFERAFAAGALLTLGDALDDQDYFDRAPELELVRHLGNGVAHGNRFDIRDPTQLGAYPAHNLDGWKTRPCLEITPELNGRTILFDFLAPGDVVAILSTVADYLQMGRPEPPPAQN